MNIRYAAIFFLLAASTLAWAASSEHGADPAQHEQTKEHEAGAHAAATQTEEKNVSAKKSQETKPSDVNVHEQTDHKDTQEAHDNTQHNTSHEASPTPTHAAKSDHESHQEQGTHESPASVEKPAQTKILPSDVRVLIDVSGSMKQTDPKNLRKPALDLIVRLLPDKSRAGVWTFGNAVNMLVPFKPVDTAWRKQAEPKSNEINSAALFTNIGKALDEVSFDKKSPSTDYKTHIILLTDGVVDINKDKSANESERQRILGDILPSLKSAGYTIHTIALSENADTELLKKLSVSTDGVFTTAISAEQLMSVFLKIFDQAVPAERVPLENNGFLVDASIKEFTALIFRKPDTDRTIIVSPEGKEFSATSPKDGVNWYRTEKYDLITADSPKAGQWKIKTEIAPESRITVVSNLQLVVDPLKNNLHSGDSLVVTYSFQENGKTIVNKDFLGLLDANAIIAKSKTEENENLTFATSTPADGIYHELLDNFSQTGDYEVHIYVDGKTFKREFKHSLTVRDTLFSLEKSDAVSETGKKTYTYKITTDEKIVDVKKSQVIVVVKNKGESNVNKPVRFIEPNRWEFTYAPEQEGEYTIDFNATGETFDATQIDEKLRGDKFSYSPKKAIEKAVKPEETHSAKEPEENLVAEHEKEDKTKEEHASEETEAKEESNNILLYSSIALGNLLLIGAGFVLYKKFFAGKAKDELAEIEKTLSAKKGDFAKPQAVAAATPPPSEKTSIDLSDEEPAHIPINDDLAVDKLFPLDSMDDPNGPDENNA